mgnify:FL=1
MADTELKKTEDVGKSEYLDNMRLMNGIAREMKEIGELPSEGIADTQVLRRVEFPAEGGLFTFMDGHPYPYRGFPYNEFVERIDLVKKIGRGFTSGLYHQLKRRPKLLLVTLIPALWFLKDLFYAEVYTNWKFLERFKLKAFRYSLAVQDLHRAFSIPRKENDTEQKLRYELRDIVCMVLEFDNAYRFRYQDVIVELDRAALQKRPRQEIARLLTIMSSREVTQEIKDTWTLAASFVKWYLLFDRKMLRLIMHVLKNTTPELARLDAGDEHWCSQRKDYVFAHMKREPQSPLTKT